MKSIVGLLLIISVLSCQNNKQQIEKVAAENMTQ